VIYLHGFASGSASSKATYLGRRLREHGIELQTPDLNLPDFSTLTVTRMLAQTRALLEASPSPQTLIGSSLGGFVAVNAAAQNPDRVDRLVLLAPALDFGPSAAPGPSRAEPPDDGSRMRKLGNVGLEQWKVSGYLPVFHYGYGRMVPVHYELYADARRYDAFNADLRMPILIFQGTRDDAVDPKTVEAWASRRPNAELHMLDDGHQLTGSLPYIWEKLWTFLTSRSHGNPLESDPARS
jgi:pimeloyl-ACP methyl ester carboxylesterase